MLEPLLLGGIVDVDLGVGVVLSVGVGLDERVDLVAAHDPGADDLHGAALLSDDLEGAEGVLAHRIAALNESSDEVGDHERDLVLVVVVVGREVDRVALRVEVFPEPGHGSVAVGSGVGVLLLPRVEGEGALGEKVEGVLCLLLGLGRSSGRSLLLLLLSLFLLGGLDGGGRERLFAERHVSDDGSKLGHRNAGVEPLHDGGKCLALLGLVHELHGEKEGADESDVSKSDGIADDEAAALEVLFENHDGLLSVSLGCAGDRRVRLHPSEDGVHEAACGDLDVVGAKVNPRVDLRGREERGASETSERGAAGDKARDRVALKDVALRRLEDRRLVHGRLALGGSRHWRDVESSELGSDEHLLGAERTCVRVELHFGLYKTNVVICIGT